MNIENEIENKINNNSSEEFIMNEFKKYDNKTPSFTLNGKNTLGRVIDIVDGDTIKIIIPLFNSFYKFTVRLNGIDTCELKSNNEENKKLGLKAKLRLIELICNDNENYLLDKNELKTLLNNNVFLIYIKCYNFDKYGRLLCDISKNNKSKCFSDILLEEKLAYKYTGKTKLTEEEQLIEIS
jgi:endonuclease YncB( thermonuclease family)